MLIRQLVQCQHQLLQLLGVLAIASSHFILRLTQFAAGLVQLLLQLLIVADELPPVLLDHFADLLHAGRLDL